MSINMTIPSAMLVKTPTYESIASYSFFKNMKLIGSSALSTSPEAAFQLSLGTWEGYSGEYVDKQVLKPITNLVSVRDYPNGGGTPTILTLTSRNDRGVRCRLKFGPLDIGEDVSKISIVDRAALNAFWAEQCGLEYAAYVQKAIMTALKGALTNMTNAAHTYSTYNASFNASNVLSNAVLSHARAKMSDKGSEKIGLGKGLWVMSPEQEDDLVGAQVGANNFAIQEGVIRSGIAATLGAPYITVDDSYTKVAGANTSQGTTQHLCYGLGAGVGQVEIKPIEFYEKDQRVEYESVANLYRADAEFSIVLNGFGWDSIGGGANPSIATLGTAANWIVGYSDAREVPACLAITNATIAD